MISNPCPLLCKKSSAITQANEPRFYKKSKHIMRCFYLIREIATKVDVVVERVSSTDNVVDPLIKPLAQ